MIEKHIPLSNPTDDHHEATEEIVKLRKQGVPCHLEEHSSEDGNSLVVVSEPHDKPKNRAKTAPKTSVDR